MGKLFNDNFLHCLRIILTNRHYTVVNLNTVFSTSCCLNDFAFGFHVIGMAFWANLSYVAFYIERTNNFTTVLTNFIYNTTNVTNIISVSLISYTIVFMLTESTASYTTAGGRIPGFMHITNDNLSATVSTYAIHGRMVGTRIRHLMNLVVTLNATDSIIFFANAISIYGKRTSFMLTGNTTHRALIIKYISIVLMNLTGRNTLNTTDLTLVGFIQIVTDVLSIVHFTTIVFTAYGTLTRIIGSIKAITQCPFSIGFMITFSFTLRAFIIISIINKFPIMCYTQILTGRLKVRIFLNTISTFTIHEVVLCR